MDDFKTIFGKNLQFIRMARGLTQSKLGELVGQSRRNIIRIENGMIFPQVSTIEKFCLCLDVPLKQLFNLSINPSETAFCGKNICTFVAVKFADILKLKLLNKDKIPYCLKKYDLKEFCVENEQKNFLKLSKLSKAPVIVVYQEYGENFQTIIFFPDNTYKVIEKHLHFVGNNDFSETVKLLEYFAYDPEVLAFIQNILTSLKNGISTEKLKIAWNDPS